MVLRFGAWSGHVQPFKGKILTKSIILVTSYTQQQWPGLTKYTKNSFFCQGKRISYRILMGHSDRKKPLGRPACWCSAGITTWNIRTRRNGAAFTTLLRRPPQFSTNVDVVVSLLSSGSRKVVSVTPWRHIGKEEVQLHLFLTSPLDGGQWSTSRPSRFTPVKCAGTHPIGGWVRPRASLDILEKRKFVCP